MARFIVDPATGKLVDAATAYASRPRPARSSLPAPIIMGDGMNPIRSMIDGTMHDSRSGYERHVRANGCQIAGNDPSVMDPKPRQVKPLGGTKESVAEALQKLGV